VAKLYASVTTTIQPIEAITFMEIGEPLLVYVVTLFLTICRVPRSVEQVIDIMKQVVAGVDYLHKSGIYHLDLKVDNLIMVQDVVKIIDMEGIFNVQEREKEQILGRTQSFCPPELLRMYNDDQALGRSLYATAECDIWAIGVIFIMLLRGDEEFYASLNGISKDNHVHAIPADVPDEIRMLVLEILNM
jgi:serine/threonine protein kinase